jgi:hypothetical protein
MLTYEPAKRQDRMSNPGGATARESFSAQKGDGLFLSLAQPFVGRAMVR